METQDAGLYSCVAHNRVGRDRCTSFIYVDGGGVQQRDTAKRSATAVEGDITKKPPTAPVTDKPTSGKIEVTTALPKTQEIFEGEELRLVCVVKSDIHVIRK